jgi:hypothetical protein
MTKKAFLNQLLLSLLAFLSSQVVLALVLYYLDYGYFNSTNWLRWDSGLYLQIASKGYELFPCAGKLGFPLNSSEICGNTGWFPGYPLLIKLFGLLFKNDVIAAGVLSKIFYFLSLLMVVKILDINSFSLKNILIICIPAFSFGFIFYSAIFPMSAVLFFALSGIYFFIRRKIWVTGLFCFLAAFFYPTGFLLSFVFAVTILIIGNEGFKIKAVKLFIPLIMGGLGVIAVFTIFQITVNDWTAFIQVQAKYGHSFQSPVKNIGSFLKDATLSDSFSMIHFIHYQSILIILGYLAISYFFFSRRMFKNELYLLAYIYITLFLIFPWTISGDLSRCRAESLLLPFVFLLKETKTHWLALILILLLGLVIPMSYLFFTGVLI